MVFKFTIKLSIDSTSLFVDHSDDGEEGSEYDWDEESEIAMVSWDAANEIDSFEDGDDINLGGDDHPCTDDCIEAGDAGGDESGLIEWDESGTGMIGDEVGDGDE